MSDENESVLIKLTRMEGKLDLSNLRHDQHDARFSVIEGRLNSQSDRIGGIEQREIGLAGERKGITTAGKWLWAVIGSIGGVLAVVFKSAFGL